MIVLRDRLGVVGQAQSGCPEPPRQLALLVAELEALVEAAGGVEQLTLERAVGGVEQLCGDGPAARIRPNANCLPCSCSQRAKGESALGRRHDAPEHGLSDRGCRRWNSRCAWRAARPSAACRRRGTEGPAPGDLDAVLRAAAGPPATGGGRRAARRRARAAARRAPPASDPASRRRRRSPRPTRPGLAASRWQGLATVARRSRVGTITHSSGVGARRAAGTVTRPFIRYRRIHPASGRSM